MHEVVLEAVDDYLLTRTERFLNEQKPSLGQLDLCPLNGWLNPATPNHW